MKAATQALKDLLYGQNLLLLADCYTFYFPSPVGTKRWTSAMVDLTFNATTWSATGPVFEKRVRASSSVGLEVADSDISFGSNGVTLNGVPMQTAALRRTFHGVRVVIERAFRSSSTTVVGMTTLFDGTISDVNPGSTQIALAAVSAVARLRMLLPRRLVQAGCPFNVYDAQCGAVKASFTDARTVAAGTTATKIVLNASSTRAVVGGWVEVGVERRTIRAVSGVELSLAAPPLPSVPANGTAVNVIRGCDHTYPTCRDVFNRLVSFGGAPFVPRSESI